MSKELYIVGLGPGDLGNLTPQGRIFIEKSQCIVGFKTYIDLIEPFFPDKEYFPSNMSEEIKRCRNAFDLAEEGKPTAIICSGDPGIYGMSSPVLEISAEYPDVTISIAAGVSASMSGAAVLGAPLGGDFLTISLSDYLVPWEVIEKRLVLAGEGDLPIVIYNPMSHARPDYLEKACDILLKYRTDSTVCGYVENIGRKGEHGVICNLKSLKKEKLSMFTTVFIGNSKTKKVRDFMVTPRGYTL